MNEKASFSEWNIPVHDGIFEIDDRTLPLIRMMAEHMPGGFFVYHAGGDEDFLFINEAMLRLTGCEDRDQFRKLTGNTFRGFVHPEDIDRVESEIACQIRNDDFKNDYVEYRISCRDGREKWLRDYGHLAHTECYGDVFCVFVDDATEQHLREVELRSSLKAQEARLQEVSALNQELKQIQVEWIRAQKDHAQDPMHRICQEANIPGSMCEKRVVPNESAKKTILVVEDSEINREILQELLQDEFRMLFAENGEAGIRLLKEHRDKLSLVLLDVYMPVCNGFEFLEKTQRDPFLSSVPVIVTTGSEKHEDEEQCLRLGATDFITKPYNPETMLGRIHNTIRLHESISELTVVEFDRLTGLYTMSAFLHHAAQQISEREAEFDLGILSIQDFFTVNRIYGERKGDEVLQYFGDLLKEKLPDTLLARQGSNFFALQTAGQEAILSRIPSFLKDADIAAPVANLRTQVGLYLKVDRQQPVSVLCDRVKLAVAESASEDGICYYDARMEQKQLEKKQLLTGFEAALQNREFVVWIQPKVDLRSSRIVGGEALVRWIDGAGNFVSPGAFIPLFEKEGQIQQLDEYIFRTVCAYQRQRKEAGKPILPISVNLSRNSLFHKGIVEIYRKIAQEEQTDLAMVPLEITESAATSAKQISGICESLVQAGFVLHMDDFGTGYSSLSALATLPFSVIKLDKTLVDQIGTNKGNIVIKYLIEAAHELEAKVVAEGVEEKAQAEFLAFLECDQIQGYFYSPPKKIPLFEELVAQEDPFADRGTIENAHSDGIIRLGSAELTRFLRICKRMFSAARLLSADCCSYSMANADGTLDPLRKPCFAIWERKERCSNCTSLKAMQTKKTAHKFEVFENEVYSVYSVYLEVDGKPHVLELLSTVGAGVLHGYKENMSLLELMESERLDLFLDVQLGTLNRRFFEESRGSLKNITALAMLDIDDFKEINDRHGHLVGDSVLAEVAHAVKGVIRETDFLIRMGGDELMIGFTGMKQQRLHAKLEEMRRAVAELSIAADAAVTPTVSIGGTTCQGYSEEARERADQALYEGKRTKNTVVIR